MDVISYALSKKYTDEKIIEQKLKVATVEKELNDYKNTLAQVNINQEPRQSASGYGIVSLPKNSANGQVSVSVEGNTETGDEGNAKSTISAMRIKSVGKNLFDGKVYGAMSDGGIIDGRDVYKIKNGGSQFWSFKGEPNTQYTLTFEYKKDSSSLGPTQFEFLYSDGTKSLVQILNNTSWANVQKTSDANKTLVGFKQLYANVGMTYIDKGTFMLNEGTGVTPYEPYKESTAYVVAKKDNKIVNLRSLPNGVADEIDLDRGKLVKRTEGVLLDGNESIGDANDVGDVYRFTVIPFNNVKLDGDYSSHGTSKLVTNGINFKHLASYYGNEEHYYFQKRESYSILYMFVEKNKIDKQQGNNTFDKFKNWIRENRVVVIYQLAEPEIVPIQVSGNIVSNPSGTVYFEKAQPDASVYNNKITIFEQELDIDYIDKLYKIDYQTGVKTEIDASKAVIAEDRKTFTHPDLVNGDMVFFEYFYRNETTEGNATVEFYDSRYTIKDKSTDKYYQWDIEVDNGVPSIKLKEV